MYFDLVWLCDSFVASAQLLTKRRHHEVGFHVPACVHFIPLQTVLIQPCRFLLGCVSLDSGWLLWACMSSDVLQ
jgi:hypothetical protein